MRGCFGGCTFCSITEHEGRIIQSRSEGSILREIEKPSATRCRGFTGVISDLGGPTANMYRLACKSREIEAACRLPSCVFPMFCPNLGTDHSALIVQLYRKARGLPGIKKVLIASGLRYDLAVRSPEYVKELAQHHVGGYLKIAPEHVEGPAEHDDEAGHRHVRSLQGAVRRYSEQAGKEQYLIPYFIAAHPGTTDEDMLELALCGSRATGSGPTRCRRSCPRPWPAPPPCTTAARMRSRGSSARAATCPCRAA
jgi:uncharacterized radical SAM protein YgiQ